MPRWGLQGAEEPKQGLQVGIRGRKGLPEMLGFRSLAWSLLLKRLILPLWLRLPRPQLPTRQGRRSLWMNLGPEGAWVFPPHTQLEAVGWLQSPLAYLGLPLALLSSEDACSWGVSVGPCFRPPWFCCLGRGLQALDRGFISMA